MDVNILIICYKKIYVQEYFKILLSFYNVTEIENNINGVQTANRRNYACNLMSFDGYHDFYS